MPDNSRTIHALVVDDEDTVQSILAAFLNRYAQQTSREIQIRTLSDPVQGLFELTTNGERYNLILLDVRLPKLTGDDIYNSLEQINPELLKRVLFVTGYPEDLAERFPGRELRILQKPFRYQAFTEKLDILLNPEA
ncbi:MAG TPA: response regulator [Mariprofundaceae bacterium]|nr:response regulator [Mariprofundaceae bacterium]